MSQSIYSIVFDSRTVPEHEMFGVKQRLKDLFNADRARIESLFTDKPTVLKRNLSREQAIKYQQMLEQSGVNVSIVEPKQAQVPEPTSAEMSNNTAEPSFSLAPAGSDLLADAAKKQAAPSISTDHLDITPQAGNLLEPQERSPAPVANVPDDFLSWDLSHEGEDLLKESEKSVWVEADMDLSALDLGESDQPLSPPSAPVDTEVSIDHISLVPTTK